MLKLTDSGCPEHCSQQITFTGAAAVLAARFILNLPPNNGGPTYICERGYTHHLTLHQRQEEVAASVPGPRLASGTPHCH